MTTTPNPILSELERTVRRNALRHHCGLTIFCPGCQGILDCRRAVEVDFLHENGELVSSAIWCQACYDKNANGFPGFAEHRELTLEVWDGRILFAKPPASTAPRAPRRKSITPVAGQVYAVRHSSGTIQWRYTHSRVPWLGSRHHYYGVNLRTGREVVLKSRARITREQVDWTGFRIAGGSL